MLRADRCKGIIKSHGPETRLVKLQYQVTIETVLAIRHARAGVLVKIRSNQVKQSANTRVTP